MAGQEFNLEVNPAIPRKLARLEDLADDLWYSWYRPARALFRLLNPELWKRTGHNPKLFLRTVDEKTLQQAAADQVFLASYHQVISAYDTYMEETARCQPGPEFAKDDLVAYFCAEYGFHESFPIYSGGLGILAGDHCKTASDMRVPFIGVGILYGQGYFTQQIDAEGNQRALYHDSDLDNLPVSPALDESGNQIKVVVDMPDRDVYIRVWWAKVGHVRLYLLDTNVEPNNQEDREITHKLYGGGAGTRIRQEIILGIGGVRALRALGIRPTVWHINEGHSAFMVLERTRELRARGLDFNAALERVAGNTVFTTHTPVPAGHDVFPSDLVLKYLSPMARELGIPEEEFVRLGQLPNQGGGFNMTTLAINGSRSQNGVSRIHGTVSAEICAECWPMVLADENPIGYVTNGVHVHSFLAQAWSDLFDRFLGAAWRNHLSEYTFWKRIDEIPDHLFWSTAQSIKSQMYYALRNCLRHQHQRNQVSESHLERMLGLIDPGDPNVLTIGFARRFATYKRATLLAHDLEWLQEILGRDDRPVVFVFAGKAHPADMPGQELLKHVHQLSSRPEFVGKILLVEGYDLALARRLVSGVDVWLNNPIHPLEASGTSGMKAAINGRLNLSLMDGWWAEGFDGHNGWGIKPSAHGSDANRRDYEDSRTLYEILQDDVIPLYYDRGPHGYSPGWVKRCKRSMATILPRFNTCRMLSEYSRKIYLPAAAQKRVLESDDYRFSREMATWRSRVRNAWPKVSLRRLDGGTKNRIQFGESTELEVAANLNGLEPDDVTVELLLSRPGTYGLGLAAAGIADGEGSLGHPGDEAHNDLMVAERLTPVGRVEESGEFLYNIQLKPDWCGKLTYKVRLFPFHQHLMHPHETGLMVWL